MATTQLFWSMPTCDGPPQHTLFGLSNEQGFSTMFKDEAAFKNPPLQAVPNSSLNVLTSGRCRPSPANCWRRKKWAMSLKRLAEMADIVIFDAPPVVTVNDASLLASQVDGVLLVVKAGGTKRDHVKAAKDRLAKVNARFDWRGIDQRANRCGVAI